MRHFLHRRELWVLAGLALLALTVLAVRALLPQGGGLGARLTFSNGTSYDISLEKDAVLHYDDGKLPVTLHVQGGRIRFESSVCPDHLCEGFGWLSREGETAVCAPAGAYLEIISSQS